MNGADFELKAIFFQSSALTVVDPYFKKRLFEAAETAWANAADSYLLEGQWIKHRFALEQLKLVDRATI